MGPDTCNSVHARMGEDVYNSKYLAAENCLACSRDYYLASPLLGSSHCLKRHLPGEECWQQDQCMSNACWGYHCCASDVAANDTRCAACNSHGQCICDASLLCEIFGTALACNNRDLRTSPCGLPHNTTVLNLQNNSLSAITPLVLDSIPSLQSLCLGLNPLNCCSMIPVQHHPALDHNCTKPAVCAYPPPFHGLLVRGVNTNALIDACFGDSPDGQDTINELSKIIGGVVVCIFVATVALVAWRVHLRRKQLRAATSSDTSNKGNAHINSATDGHHINVDGDGVGVSDREPLLGPNNSGKYGTATTTNNDNYDSYNNTADLNKKAFGPNSVQTPLAPAVATTEDSTSLSSSSDGSVHNQASDHRHRNQPSYPPAPPAV